MLEHLASHPPGRTLSKRASTLVIPSSATHRNGFFSSLHTFGDAVLDCRHYNDQGVDPGRLIVHNDDRLFPECRERDL